MILCVVVCYVSQNDTFSWITPVILDTTPAGKNFGDIVTDVAGPYKPGDTVSAVFVCGNPRNNLMTDATFLTVESTTSAMDVTEDAAWTTVYNDADWSTIFRWSRRGTISESFCTITWTIPTDWPVNSHETFRIGHFGYRKGVFGVFP